MFDRSQLELRVLHLQETPPPSAPTLCSCSCCWLGPDRWKPLFLCHKTLPHVLRLRPKGSWHESLWHPFPPSGRKRGNRDIYSPAKVHDLPAWVVQVLHAVGARPWDEVDAAVVAGPGWSDSTYFPGAQDRRNAAGGRGACWAFSCDPSDGVVIAQPSGRVKDTP